jgi:hypothetical protein
MVRSDPSDEKALPTASQIWPSVTFRGRALRYCKRTVDRDRLLAIVREMTEDERQQLEMWWARLSTEQRVECRSLDLSNPVPTGHVLWSQPLLDVTGGLVPHPPGVYVNPCVMEFLAEKRQVSDA